MLQAAEGGLAEAQFAVAGYYRDGTGVAKDLETARLWYERAASSGFAPARKELAALTQPAASAPPAVEDGAATPAEKQQAQKTETPPQPAGTPAATGTEDAAPTATQQSATPPAEEPPAPPAPAEPPQEASMTPSPPAGEEAQPAEDQAQEGAPESPPGDGDAASGAEGPASDLPVAESLTGDAQVYRIWLYTSGQEGDARSYWNKLTMQYPRLLKDLELDLRRYFLGEAKGSLYRVFAGPFEDLGAAQKACEDIKRRFGDQFCRPVLN
jgi:hypothetical protein